jgi:ParB-like chromosome segregation protein Spo0J
VGQWDFVVPVTSVVVTGLLAIWSDINDVRAKREDRQHAQALGYEKRVWQAKSDALRTLISASRLVKRKAQIAQQAGTEDRKASVNLIQALDEFEINIGGEGGISEIVAYAAEPVRDALDEMLRLIEEQTGPDREQLSIIRKSKMQLRLLKQAAKDEDNPEVTDLDLKNLQQENATLRERRMKASAEIEADADIDVDAVVELCDRVIDVARQDIQGRSGLTTGSAHGGDPKWRPRH